MRKKIFQEILVIALIFITSQSAFSQELKESISLNFNLVSKQKVIEEIEVKSGYQFYFNPVWFDNENVLISGDFKDTSVRLY